MTDESLSDLYWCFLFGFCLAILIVKSDEIFEAYVKYEIIRVNEEHRLDTVIHNEYIYNDRDRTRSHRSTKN